MIIGYAQSTVCQGQITSITDAFGLEITIDVAEGQAVKLSAYFPSLASSVPSDRVDASIWEGPNQLQVGAAPAPSVGAALSPSIVVFPSPGVHTYRARLARGYGTGVVTSFNSENYPAYLLAEAGQ